MTSINGLCCLPHSHDTTNNLTLLLQKAHVSTRANRKDILINEILCEHSEKVHFIIQIEVASMISVVYLHCFKHQILKESTLQACR